MSDGLLLLAQASDAYTGPFVRPMPMWDYWWLLFFPLLLGICTVYKAVKVSHLSQLPRAALTMSVWVTLAFVMFALGLYGFVKVMQ
jgi:hypothetical protein